MNKRLEFAKQILQQPNSSIHLPVVSSSDVLFDILSEFPRVLTFSTFSS